MLMTVHIILIIAAVAYLAVMLKWDMQMMQQNSYRNERYLAWLRTSNDYMSMNRIISLAMLFLMMAGDMGGPKSYFVLAIVAVVLIFQSIALLKKKYKKPLVFTKRVQRLYFTELVILVAVAAVIGLNAGKNDGFVMYYITLNVVTFATFSCIFTMAVNWLMKPVEKAINKKYYNDAKRILTQMPQMKIIGITGSYGKTSTKHYLNRILSEQFSVLMTPGSFNTPMGVIRTVREMLQPYNEVFIVEMGAKNIGDIKEICDLVHPQMGILTAVGPQHLESFKTIENVQRTKFELVDALPHDGFAVINNDFPYVANREVTNVEVKRYAVGDNVRCDYHSENVEYSERGTKFTVKGDGKSIDLETKLVGECNISNLMAAVIIAMKLEVPEKKIQYAVSKIEQVEHRLNMKRTASGITIIDDAYNSNPQGSKMALDVLGRMTKGKRIVITPGMIELGDKQEYYNELFGEHIAETCDVAIVVGKYNHDAIMEGIKKKGMKAENVHETATFNEAQALMMKIAAVGDTVLYENDLPDTFK